MSIRSSFITVCLVSSLLSVEVFAGAGAAIRGCIYYPTPPTKPILATFTAGGSADNCMNNKGSSANVTVINAGVTCADIGYVEGKGSSSGGDTCATDDSIWQLSYSASAQSGSTLTKWTADWFTWNNLELSDQSKGTNVCGSGNLCSAAKIRWGKGTQGPLWVIFNPFATSLPWEADPDHFSVEDAPDFEDMHSHKFQRLEGSSAIAYEMHRIPSSGSTRAKLYKYQLIAQGEEL